MLLDFILSSPPPLHQFDPNPLFPRASLLGVPKLPNNVCRVTTWPALENVTKLCDMTRFIQTLDMCAFRANVTRLLAVCKLARYFNDLFRRVVWDTIFMVRSSFSAFMRY
jgi:hypothetical protein